MWSDSRHAEDDKHVELEYEWAVALADVTEGAARSTVLKVAQVNPSHGSWHAAAIIATSERCKDAKELKELIVWPLRVAAYEQEFKVIDEAQKTFVVREMMPKDIKREFLTGPKNPTKLWKS